MILNSQIVNNFNAKIILIYFILVLNILLSLEFNLKNIKIMANREGLQNLTIQEFLDYPIPANVQNLASNDNQSFVGPNTLRTLQLREHNIVSEELAAIAEKMDLLEISAKMSNDGDDLKIVTIDDINSSTSISQLYGSGSTTDNPSLINVGPLMLLMWLWEWYETCHNSMADKFGIWVPELEATFSKLDGYLGNPPNGDNN